MQKFLPANYADKLRWALSIIMAAGFFAVAAQPEPGAPPLPAYTSLTLDASLLGHPLLLYPGFTLEYARPIASRGRQRLTLAPALGYVRVPERERRYLTRLSLQYRLQPLTWLELQLGMGLAYVLTRLDFERYDYDDQGNFSVQGRHIHRLAPTTDLRLAFALLRSERMILSPLLGLSLVRYDRSYRRRMLEGFQPSLSLGLQVQF